MGCADPSARIPGGNPSLHDLERRLQAIEAETREQEKATSSDDDADDVGEGLAALRFNLRGEIEAIPINSVEDAVIKLRVLLDQEAARDIEDLSYREIDRGCIKQVLSWLEGQQHAAAPAKPTSRLQVHVQDLEAPLSYVQLATRILTTLSEDAHDLNKTLDMVDYMVERLHEDVETLQAVIYGKAAEQPVTAAGEAVP